MKKIPLGLLSGLVLGLLDGLSAIPIPEAQPMLHIIIPSATIKGLVTGGLAGLMAKRINGIGRNVLAGAALSAGLSAIAAIPTGAYAEIITPGIIIGGVMGFIVSKWGK